MIKGKWYVIYNHGRSRLEPILAQSNVRGLYQELKSAKRNHTMWTKQQSYYGYKFTVHLIDFDTMTQRMVIDKDGKEVNNG